MNYLEKIFQSKRLRETKSLLDKIGSITLLEYLAQHNRNMEVYAC